MFIPDPGSEFFPSRIPDPNCLHPGSRILKEFKYFNPQKSKKKWFLSSKKYDPGCSSRIPDPDADFLTSRIPDPGSRGQKGTQSRIPDPDRQHWILHAWSIFFKGAHQTKLWSKKIFSMKTLSKLGALRVSVKA
jgi:hypothetical protein